MNEIVLEGLRDIYIFLLKIYVLVYVKKMKFVEENIIVICKFLDYIKIKVKIYCIRLFIFFDKIYFYGIDIVKGFFLNFFDLLRYILIKVVFIIDCYWGYNLSLIRMGIIIRNNYIYLVLC